MVLQTNTGNGAATGAGNVNAELNDDIEIGVEENIMDQQIDSTNMNHEVNIVVQQVEHTKKINSKDTDDTSEDTNKIKSKGTNAASEIVGNDNDMVDNDNDEQNNSSTINYLNDLVHDKKTRMSPWDNSRDKFIVALQEEIHLQKSEKDCKKTKMSILSNLCDRINENINSSNKNKQKRNGIFVRIPEMGQSTLCTPPMS